MKNRRFIKQFNVDRDIDPSSYEYLYKYKFHECTNGFLESHTYCGFPTEKIEIEIHKKNFKKRIHGNSIKQHFTDKDGEYLIPIYKTNEYGYRSDSWKNGDEGNIFLGCSDTFGVGQHWHYTWPVLLTKSLQIRSKVYNLALPGGTLDSCYRTLKSHIKDISGEYVFLLSPQYSRAEFFDDVGRRYLISGGSLSRYKKKPKLKSAINWFLDYKTQPIQLWVDYNRNLDAIENICNKAGKKLVQIYNPMYYNKSNPKFSLTPNMDYAFDCLHYGVKFQKHIRDLFLEKLNIKDS